MRARCTAMTPEQESRAREIKGDCRQLPMWAASKIITQGDQVDQLEARIADLERMLDFAIPTWRTPQDDGHDMEVATIGLQRQELKQLRERVAALEDEFQVWCPECAWHGQHAPTCSRRVTPLPDDPTSPF